MTAGFQIGSTSRIAWLRIAVAVVVGLVTNAFASAQLFRNSVASTTFD